MPFIPHTDHDVRQMLQHIGVASIDELFDEIPAELKESKLSTVPLQALMREVEQC